jgi:hypothetical protein
MMKFIIYQNKELNADAQLNYRNIGIHFYEIMLDTNMGCGFQVDSFKFEKRKKTSCTCKGENHSPKQLWMFLYQIPNKPLWWIFGVKYMNILVFAYFCN